MSPARTMEAAARQKMMNAARTRKAMDKMHRLSRYNDSAAFAVCEWSSMGLPDASDSRLGDLTRWVFDDLGFAGSRIEPASVDASFRRYFRVTRGEDIARNGPERAGGAGKGSEARPAAALGFGRPAIPRCPRHRRGGGSALRGCSRRALHHADGEIGRAHV